MPKSETDTKKRQAAPGTRTRRDFHLVEVKPVDAPTPEQLGTSHLYTTVMLQGGPRALIRAEHEAARLSAKFGEDIEAKWCLATKWLLSLNNSTAGHRARARYAMQWRPRFLAVVALTRSLILAARAAKVSRSTVNGQRLEDPDFNDQVIAAQEQAVDLLADMTMRTAIEGECKPIYWQGIRVGHQVEYDNRLRIEMLRAYRPDQFKTPGSKINVNTGSQTFLGGAAVGSTEVLQLQEMRARSLEKIAKARVIEPPALTDAASFEAALGTGTPDAVPPAP